MANKNPVKHVWMVEDVPASGARDEKSFWTKIGVAPSVVGPASGSARAGGGLCRPPQKNENHDGSLTLTLAAIPVSGRMIIRAATPVLGATKDSTAEASAKDGVQ